MAQFIRLTAEEQTYAFPWTDHAIATPHTRKVRDSPRTVLERVVASAFSDRPVYVLFSGGRDSSAVLALAIREARRLGADDPVPVIIRHRNAPRSEEREWQELVLDHLAVSSPRVVNFHGEQSLLSEAATESLRQHGLLWPPALHLHRAIYRTLEPGTILTGEGGDLIIEGRRITPLADTLRQGRLRTSLRAARQLMRETKVRSQLAERLTEASPWLTPQARRHLYSAVDSPPEPLRWNRSLKSDTSTRPAVLARSNFESVVRAHGHIPLNPLENAEFVRSLEHAGGMFGLGSRTQMMRYLFHDLLPDAVLSRTSKAAFNETRWLELEHSFARDWRGEGIDHDLIDAEALRHAWLSPMPSPLAAVHLHAAWLDKNNVPVVSDVA